MNLNGDKSSVDYEYLFATIKQLIMCHSPSGVEGEVDQFLLTQFQALEVEHWQDRAGNIIAKIPGLDSNRAIAITGHKDEIGAIIKSIDDKGCLQVRKLGGSFPWVYGEGVVDILGDKETITGILSFGSRHVSHESPQKAHQENAPHEASHTCLGAKCEYLVRHSSRMRQLLVFQKTVLLGERQGLLP